MDKLSFVKSSRSLRCSFKIFSMLCPILIGPLFHQGFCTNDGLDFLSAHEHGPVRPVRPHSPVFIPFSCPLHPIWSVTFAQGGQLGWRLKQSWRFDVHGATDRNIHRRWQIQAKMTIVSIEWTVTQSIQWRSKLYSWRWRGPLDDGLWSMRPSGLQRSDKLQRYLRRMTRVTRRMARISDRSAASSSVHSIYKN